MKASVFKNDKVVIPRLNAISHISKKSTFALVYFSQRIFLNYILRLNASELEMAEFTIIHDRTPPCIFSYQEVGVVCS